MMQVELNNAMTKWFDSHLSMKNTPFAKQNPSLVYQDLSPCCELIANVYLIDQKYVVKSEELKFIVNNLLEVFDCINDISKAYKKYGKCWFMYNKIRKDIDKEEYEKYSIYVSDYGNIHKDKSNWMIDLLNAA